jgi:hypothetical protein
MVFLSASSEMPEQYLKLVYDRFVPYPSKSALFCNHPIIGLYAELPLRSAFKLLFSPLILGP